MSLSPLPGNSYNFFQANFSNHIAPPSGATAILAKKFNQASGCVGHVGLSDLCAFGADGVPVPIPVFPYKINLFSNTVQFPSAPVSQDGINAYLSKIPPATPLFTLYAFDSPEAYHADTATVLGEMV